MAEAGSIYGAAFRACVVSAIPYKVYAVRAGHEEVTNTGDLLQRAEVALRKSGQNIFVSLSASRRELWTFRLITKDKIESVHPVSEHGYSGLAGEHSNDTDDSVNNGVPDFEISLDLPIQTVAQGVFLPPFSVTPDIGPEEGHPRSYRRLLRAIETKCLDALMNQGDREIYEAFGPLAVLNMIDHSLTRVTPVLQHDGTLMIRLTSQQCQLRRLFLHSTKLATPHVWLLPHGMPGRVFPSQKFEDFVERPNKKLARALHNILTSHFVTNVNLDSLERSTWLRVSTQDAQDLLWPAVLVTEVTLNYNGTTSNGDTDDSYRPLARIEKPDPYTTLSEAMAAARRQVAASEEVEPEVGVASLHQTMHPPVAPPPSPRQSQLPLPVPPSSGISNTSYSGTGYNTASASRVPSAAVTAAPTPTASGPHQGAMQTPTVYPTPIYHTPSMATPSGENWMEVDEDEVGDADFNFFDLPVSSHATPLFRQPEQPKEDERPVQFVEKDLRTAIVPPESVSSERNKPEYTSCARFSTLEFNTSALDAKYISGGQYFVPPPSESNGDSNGESSTFNDAEVEEREEEEEEEEEDEEEDEEENDQDNDDMDLASVYSDELDFGMDSVPAILTKQVIMEDTVELWYKSLRSVSSPPAPADATRLTSFRQLIPQLVYDGGLLNELLDAPMATGQVELVCGSALTRIRSVFPGLHHCSLLEMSGSSNEDSLQLLSPPLVTFKRNDEILKARISIIKFWRIMGLSPLTDVGGDNISVILITLSSPTVIAGAQTLLTSLKTLYEGGNLGEVDLPSFGDVHDGLLTISADLRHTSGDAVGDLYETACAQLKHQLQQHFRGKNLVLITACPTSRRGGMLTAGVAFQLALGYGAVRTACPNAQWLLCSLGTLVSRYNHDIVPSQNDAMRLALLVHSRFPNFKPAFQLAGLAPQSVGLQFSANPPTYLLDDEPVMQISYLICDKRWVFVAWSDQWARITTIDVLRMADRHDKTDQTDRALHSVFSEIWARSKSLAEANRPKWRICIAKCGTMEMSELLVWRRVITQSRDSDTAHCIMELPYPRGLAVNDGRPVRHSTHAQTSSAEMVDSVIVDSTNETYGVTISRTKPGVSTSVDHIAVGYLLHPTDRGHLQFEIRLLMVHALPGTPQKVMTRVLGQFRRLASLAESRGVSATATIVPWHVLAVTKLEAAAIEMGL